MEGEHTTAKQLKLAEAATNQFQAEECYRTLINSLRTCRMSDKSCLRHYAPLSATCHNFGTTAAELLSAQFPENEL